MLHNERFTANRLKQAPILTHAKAFRWVGRLLHLVLILRAFQELSHGPVLLLQTGLSEADGSCPHVLNSPRAEKAHEKTHKEKRL